MNDMIPDHSNAADWYINGWPAVEQMDVWQLLEWDTAWVDGGPSPAGNNGPYWHVRWHPVDDHEDEIWARLYPVKGASQ